MFGNITEIFIKLLRIEPDIEYLKCAVIELGCPEEVAKLLLREGPWDIDWAGPAVVD